MIDEQQKTEQWLRDRLGHVTASRFADVLTEPRSRADKEAGVLSATAKSYLFDIVGEHLTGEQADCAETFAMKRGTELEPEARREYIWKTGNPVQDIGFVRHPFEKWIGASPDGLVGEEGSIEIKCPLSYSKHITALYEAISLSPQPPEEHVAQIQGVLWVTGRQWCDFVSFDPRMPQDQKLAIVRVNRDPEFITELEQKVIAFRDKLFRVLSQIKGKSCLL